MSARLVAAVGLGIALLVSPGARANPDLLPELGRQLYDEALRAEEAGNSERALAAYGSVLQLRPDFTRARLAVGRLLAAEGRFHDAVDNYRGAPGNADVVEALGRLYMSDSQPSKGAEAFAQLRRLRYADPEPYVLEAWALADFDPQAGSDRLQRWLGFDGVGLDADAEVAMLAVYDGLIAVGSEDRAEELLERLLQRFPEHEGLVERADRLRVVRAARLLAGAAPEPLGGALAAQVGAGRAALAEGRPNEARRILVAVADQAPRNPEVWSALTDVYLALGDPLSAEDAVLRARALDPLDQRHPERLARLLTDAYGGRYDEAALDAWTDALALNPTRSALFYDKALVEERLGDRQAAAASLRRFLAGGSAGTRADDAHRRLASYLRERPAPPVIPPAPGRPATIDPGAWEAVHLAVIYRREGRLEQAKAELDRALAMAPDFPRALNQRAGLALEGGNRVGAEALYLRSLEAQPGQPGVLLVLGEIAAEAGEEEESREYLVAAANAGAMEAHVHLARAKRLNPWASRAHLEQYFARTSSGPYHEEAEELLARAQTWIRVVFAAGIGLAAAWVVVPAWLWIRRRTGITVAELVSRAPRTAPEVAAIASALRHEVLKHDTTVLPMVAEALEARDPGPARWAADRLYGARGTLVKYREHLRALRSVGREHGVRLALEHGDPVFGPLDEGFQRLERLRRDLEGGGGPKVAREVRQISDLLNRQAYRALGDLVRRLCVIELDEELVRGVFDGVEREAVVAQRALPEVDLAMIDESLWLRMYRGDLEDVLANLIRNAVEACADGRGSRVVVTVDVEADDITGVERVEVRVADDAPARLSTAMIRSRYIEGGLGITVDRVSRSGGSIHVEDEPGLVKAVVIRLPRVEAEEEGEA